MKEIIDIRGSKGNAFYLLAVAKKCAQKIGKDPDPILKDMRRGDYENLLSVFKEHFNEHYTILR